MKGGEERVKKGERKRERERRGRQRQKEMLRNNSFFFV